MGDILSIGVATLRLGMSRDAALSELGTYYSLRRVPESVEQNDYWLIFDKLRSDESLGEIHFLTGKLTWASKDWTHENKQYSGSDAAEIIYRLFSKLEAEGNTNCVVKTSASRQSPGPGHLEFRETRIICGHRQVEIILSWQSGVAYLQVNEVVSTEPLYLP